MSLAFDRPLLEEQLTTAATDVLETMFFSSVEAAVEPASLADGQVDSPVGSLVSPDRIGASLDFHGACAGRLALTLDRATAQELASSFFGGISEEGPEADSKSVMAELSNMICGAMLSHLDRKSIFCLDSPQALGPGEEASGEIVRKLCLDGGILQLAFSLHDYEAASRSRIQPR